MQTAPTLTQNEWKVCEKNIALAKLWIYLTGDRFLLLLLLLVPVTVAPYLSVMMRWLWAKQISWMKSDEDERTTAKKRHNIVCLYRKFGLLKKMKRWSLQQSNECSFSLFLPFRSSLSIYIFRLFSFPIFTVKSVWILETLNLKFWLKADNNRIVSGVEFSFIRLWNHVDFFFFAM